MKKIFDFGKFAIERPNVPTNRITVEMEYTEKKPGQKVLSICGTVWNSRRTDCIMGGQCLDEIAEYVHTPEFLEIYRLWKLYHLNDMHPECKHQAAAGWREKAGRKVTLYHWRLTREVMKEQKAAEQAALSALKAGESFTPSPDQSFISRLSYSLTTPTETPPEEIARYYEPKKPLYPGDEGHTETKALGWLREDEHPEGLLSKPCPVCGYKYGHGWNYFPIPAEDERIIEKLIKEGSL